MDLLTDHKDKKIFCFRNGTKNSSNRSTQQNREKYQERMNNLSITVVERCSRASPFVPPSKIGITKPQPSPSKKTYLPFLLALAAHLNKGDIPDEIEITRKGKEHDPPLEFYWVIIRLPWIFPDVLQLSLKTLSS